MQEDIIHKSNYGTITYLILTPKTRHTIEKFNRPLARRWECSQSGGQNNNISIPRRENFICFAPQIGCIPAMCKGSIARRTTSTTRKKKLNNNQFLFTNSEARTTTNALITTRSVYHNDERNVKRSKWLRCHIPYYANWTATFQLLLLSGDIEVNPGWQEDHSRDTGLRRISIQGK